MRPGERRRLAEHVGRAGHGEPRRDGVAEPPVGGAVPARDQVGRFLEGPLEDRRRLDDRVVGPAVHHDLAQDGPDAVRLGGLEGGLHGRRVDRAVGQHGRGAGRGERLEDVRRQALRDRCVRPRSLRREGQPVQPRQQVDGEPDAGVRELRQMGVQVDHARASAPTAAGRWRRRAGARRRGPRRRRTRSGRPRRRRPGRRSRGGCCPPRAGSAGEPGSRTAACSAGPPIQANRGPDMERPGSDGSGSVVGAALAGD